MQYVMNIENTSKKEELQILPLAQCFILCSLGGRRGGLKGSVRG
jgi:hypothetical protein